MYEPYQHYLSELQAKSKYRKLCLLSQDTISSYINFSTNDYLALNDNAEILYAALEAGKKYGVGATGSRLLSGNSELFEEFESRIANDKKTEVALIFNTGFQANISVLSAILDTKILNAKPIVFFDMLNHASLYQAVFLSSPELVRYRHNDIEHLKVCLERYKDDNRPKFIVTETVFGMDGDVIDINEIVLLVRQYKTFLYLDEAHATGLLGPNGYGLSTTIELDDVSCIIMGTFSKALGCCGAYVACNKILKDFLINKAQGFIYSTANSPMLVGAAYKAWDMIQYFDEKRKYLLNLSEYLRCKLTELGFDTGESTTNIIPVILRQEETALRFADKLLQNKIIVSCVRPPSVPPGSSRIRLALTTKHNQSDIEKLISGLKTCQ